MKKATQKAKAKALEILTNKMVAVALTSAFVGFTGGMALMGITLTEAKLHRLSPQSSALSLLLGAGVGVTLSSLVGLSLIQEKNQAISEAAKRTSTAQKEVVDAKQRLKALQDQLTQSREESVDLLKELQQFSDAYEQASKANKSLALVLDERNREILELNEHNQKLQTLVDRDEAAFDAALDEALNDQATEMQEAALKAARAQLEAHLQKISNAIPKAVCKRAKKLSAPLEAKIAELESERDALLSEITNLKAQIPGMLCNLEAALNEDTEAASYLATIEKLQHGVVERDRRIESLEAQVSDLTEALNAPKMFGSGSLLNRGNRLLAHAQEQGIILDAVDRRVSSDKAVHTFRFNARFDVVPEDALITLNRDAAKLRDELEALEPVMFKYDPENLLYYVSVTLNKRVMTRDDIDRLWLRPSAFKRLVKDVCAFRVSANKGGSKSPTVRNILGAKLLQGEKFKIRRYDPSAGSRKDFWRVAPTWNAYDQALAMAYEILKVIRERQAAKKQQPGTQFKWIYYVIDELDNTVADCNGRTAETLDGGEKTESQILLGAISKAAKEGEHLNIGLIVCTQTPNTRQLMKDESIDKAFWNNFTQIVVEANVFDYLGNSADGTKFTDLTNKFRQVSDWCNTENQAIEDEARKYRPALYVGKNRRDIIQLPLLGEYGFDKLDAAEPYDFEGFNAYDYPDPRSLDVCLGQAQNPTQRGTNSAQSDTKAKSSPKPEKPCQGNAARNSLVSQKTEKCPICGSRLHSNGIVKSGKHAGERQLICRNSKHTRKMGSKTYYSAIPAAQAVLDSRPVMPG
ncbi:MAG: hypothetical protein F6K42_00525 [Leptolyngbya sp. SIO1D8]|nr:hypothetical protein [Leptolyngbya sp. SIO1D8]